MANSKAISADQHAIFDALLRKEVRASMADKRPPIPIDAIFRRLEARHARTMKTKRGSSS